MQKSLHDKIKTAPRTPGVYLFKDGKKRILYIGKAANLQNRLSSYLNQDDLRNQMIISNSRDVDIIITQSDTEALTLEESLIKLHKPRYNVRLKDDKKFPYLKITVQEDFPRITFTRDISPDGSLNFGPYTNARALRRTRDALCRIFKLVSCNKNLTRKSPRACLEYNLGRCCAPCTGSILKKDYAQLVRKAIAFLKGNSLELEQKIERTMWQFAKNENFKAAAALRDQLVAIRHISKRQQVVSSRNISRDVIGISYSRQTCVACLFRIRENRLISKEIFYLTLSPRVTVDEISSAFVRLIYTHVSFVPKEIVIIPAPRDWKIQKKWFNEKGFRINLSTGTRGEPKRLLAWAQRNAENELSRKVLKQRVSSSLLELQDILQLNHTPRWIEAFDVSNIGDKYAVASSVAFRDGKPYKQRYRHYRIKRVQGQNDFAMIHEVVSRRIMDLKKLQNMPDLLLIDGGPGQLHAALQALKRIRQVSIPIFALAKRKEELYDCHGHVVSIPATSKSMYLLKRLRNEAHRFAISYHQKVRSKSLTTSFLDTIHTVGKVRKMQLLKYFGSIEAIKKASEEDISRVPGIGKQTTRLIYEILHS